MMKMGGSSGPAPYKATNIKSTAGASEKGAVQSPFKSKDKIAKRGGRKYGGRRSSR